MNNDGMLKPALAGGILLGVLSVLPVIQLFNCFCCAWIIGGGMLAAYLYVKDSPSAVKLGSGVLLGLFTGAIGAAVSAAFSIPLRFLTSRGSAEIITRIQQELERMPNVPPESREIFRNLFERGNMGVFFFAFGMIFLLVVYCLMAMLGGAIGVALFEKRKPGAPSNGTSANQPPINLSPPPSPL